MDSNTVTILVGIISAIVGVGPPIGIFIYQSRKAESTRKLTEKNARKEILSVVAGEIAQPEWGTLSVTTIESLIRNRARELNLNLTIDLEFPILIQDLTTQILGDNFLGYEFKNKLITRVKDLETQFKRTRPVLETLEFERLAIKPQIKWLRVITLFCFYFVISTSAALVTLLAILYFAEISIDIGYARVPLIAGLTSAVLSLIKYLREYQMATKEHEKATISYKKTGVETIRKVLESSRRKASIRREYQVTMGDQRIIIDLVLESDGERFPIEMKYKVQQSDVEAMALSVNRLQAKQGIIISYLKANAQTKELAQSKNVAIFENVISEADIVQILKDEAIE